MGLMLMKNLVNFAMEQGRETNMNGLERCPDCFKLPELTIEDKGPGEERYIWTCTQPNHVHEAMSGTPIGSIANWNLYVMLLRTMKGAA